MDVIYRAFAKQFSNPYRPFSVRMIDQEGRVFGDLGGPNAPASWDTFPLQVHSSLEEVDTIVASTTLRDELWHEFATALSHSTATNEVDPEAWEEAKDAALRTDKWFAQTKKFKAAQDKDASQTNTQPLAPGTTRQGDGDSDTHSAQQKEQGSIETEEHAAHGGAEDPVGSRAAPPAVPNALQKLVNPFDGLRRKNISYSRQVFREGFEFTQVIEIWVKTSVALMSWSGPKIYDHSASTIRVLRRKLGTDEPWQDEAFMRTRNHGTIAGSGNMELIRTCDHFPVTKGYYNWMGECEGIWGTGHVCNDDTAYQIWHAYGEWNGGRRCLGKKRGSAPTCDKPW